MSDKADVRLVDPHAEGDGRDDDDAFLAQKPILVALARRRFEAGMIGESVAAARPEPGCGLLDRPAGEAIDDPGVAGMLGGQKPPELVERAAFGHDAVEEVRPVVAGGEDPASARFSCATMSRRVGPSAVAVSAMTGTRGNAP